MIWMIAIALYCQHTNGLALGGLFLPNSAAQFGQEMVALEPAREKFIAAVSNGHLRGFDDRRGQVVFRPTHDVDSSHRPGPMEDDVIASTLRSRIVEDTTLHQSGVKVSSEAGRVLITGTPGDAAKLAKLIVLALDLDGVTRVRADLPPTLRVKS